MKNWSDPLSLGDLTLKNRVFLAALTRQRCDPKTNIPNEMVAQYYSQRSGAGLMLTQATSWNAMGRGFIGAACLYNRQHMEGWKNVLQAVHQKGGRLFLQIFHAGRVTHPLKNEQDYILGPSPIAVKQIIRDIDNRQFPQPRQMTLEDIAITKNDFQQSIKLAKQAGFDGIQLHGAHGYIIDSFLRTSSNQRKDIYGGSVENRVRFALQLTDITLKYFPSQRVGIKISPAFKIKDVYDEKPTETYSVLLQELQKRKIGFVQIRQSPDVFPDKAENYNICKFLRQFFSGILILNGNLDEKTGLEKIREGVCDAVSFGRLYIPNPDLAERIINGWEIERKQESALYYGSQLGANGYINYPFFKKSQ